MEIHPSQQKLHDLDQIHQHCFTGTAAEVQTWFVNSANTYQTQGLSGWQQPIHVVKKQPEFSK